MSKKEIDLQVFKDKYLKENLTIPECASFFSCGKSTIVRFCKRNGIKKPTELINKNNSRSSTIHNHSTVLEMYFENNLTK